MLGELGLADMGDQASGAGDSPRVSDEHNNPHGGFLGLGRGPNMINRGGRGGRGQYRAQENRSWANVASASVRSEVNLKFFPPKLDQDKIFVEMPPASPSVKWEACLVGYFIDKNSPYNLIKNNATNMWKNKGLVDILKNNDVFILKKNDV